MDSKGFNSPKASLRFSLYFSSIVLGSGMLALPLAGANLGFLPLFVAIILVGLWLAAVYVRYAHILAHNVDQMANTTAARISRIAGSNGAPSSDVMERINEVSYQAEAKKGAAQFDELIRRAGMGKVASIAFLLGMVWYLLLSIIGYILIGSGSIAVICSTMLPSSLLPNIFIVLFGLAMTGISTRFDRVVPSGWMLFGTVRGMVFMVGIWTAGLGLLRLLELTGTIEIGDVHSTILTMALFLAAVVGTMLFPEPEERLASQGNMTVEHRVNVVLVTVEIALLVFVGLAVLFLFWKYGLIVGPKIIGDFSLSTTGLGYWSNMIGLVIFAYAGAGLFNIVRYKQLFQKNRSGKAPLAGVLRVGTFIPLVVYLFWSLIVAMTLDSETLSALDQDRSYATVGLAAKTRAVDPRGALVVEISGYFLALLAVTSASKGTAESLADRVSMCFRDLRTMARSAPSPAGRKQRQKIAMAIFVIAGLLALFISARDIVAITPLLSLAGNVGGGLVLLVFPFFFLRPGTQKRRWIDPTLGIGTACFLAALGAMTVYTSLDSTGALGLVLRGLGFGITLGLPLTAVWLALDSRKARTGGSSASVVVMPLHKEQSNLALIRPGGHFAI